MKIKWGLFIILIGLVSSCAKKTSPPTQAGELDAAAAAQAAADVSNPAARIKFEVLESGGSFAFPGDSAPQNLTSLDEAVYSGNQVIFTNVLPFPRTTEKDYFIVWSADSFSQAVTSVEYKANTSTGELKSSEVAERTQATYDPVSRRYFISFSELFAGRRVDITPSDQQTLRLNVIFQNGTTTEVVLKFRVAGIPPKPSIVEDVFQKQNAQESAALLNNSALEVGAQYVLNSTSRPLKLWAQTNLVVQANYRSFLTLSRSRSGPVSQSNVDPRVIAYMVCDPYDTQPDSPLSRTEQHLASSDISSQLAVSVGKSTKTELGKISTEGEWISVIVPAGEFVKLRIMAGPAGGANSALAAQQTITRGWDSEIITRPTHCPFPNAGTASPGPDAVAAHPHHDAPFLESYAVGGVEITGGYETESLFSEVSETLPPLELPRSRAIQTIDIIFGNLIPADAIPTWTSIVHL